MLGSEVEERNKADVMLRIACEASGRKMNSLGVRGDGSEWTSELKKFRVVSEISLPLQ